VRTPLLALCVLLVATSAAQAQTRTFPIARFAVVDEGLSRGARPSFAAIDSLARHGYHTVVSFIHDPAESVRVCSRGMRYVEIPMVATVFGAAVPTDHELDRFFGAVLDSSGRPVYMHCMHGKDRTGAMAALYRVEVSGWKNAKATAEMDSMGFNGLYRNLHRFVLDYKPRGYLTKRTAATD
jgi:hypothetical protein